MGSSAGPQLDEVPRRGLADRVARLKARGTALGSAGDLRGALDAFEAASALAPELADLHELRAQALLGLDRPLAAATAAETATRARPDWPVAHMTLARALRNAGPAHLERALGAFEDVPGPMAAASGAPNTQYLSVQTNKRKQMKIL